MYKQVLESIAGVEIFPVISMIIFFTLFILILGWIFTLKKDYINKMENLPLEDDSLIIGSTTDDRNNLNAGGVK